MTGIVDLEREFRVDFDFLMQSTNSHLFHAILNHLRREESERLGLNVRFYIIYIKSSVHCGLATLSALPKHHKHHPHHLCAMIRYYHTTTIDIKSREKNEFWYIGN